MSLGNYPIEMLYEDANISVGSWGDVFLAYFKNQSNLEAITNFQNHLTRFRDNKGRKVGFLVVVSDKAKVPDNQARKSLAAFMAKTDLLLSATVIERAKGFWGAAALGVMSYMESSARQTFPNKNFGDLNAAASWYAKTAAELGGEVLTASQISTAVNSFISKTKK